MSTAIFTKAPEVEEIVNRLRQTVERFAFFNEYDIPISCWFRDDLPKSKGSVVLATIQPIAGIVAAEVNRSVPYYRLIVTKQVWDELTDTQQEALIYHELCHAKIRINDETGEVNLGSRGHDWEDFSCVVEVYGLWRPSLKHLGKVIKAQPQMLLEIEEGGLSSVTISTDDRSVTLTGEQFDRAAAKIAGKS